MTARRISRGIRRFGAFDRGITVLIGDMRGVSHGAWGRLMMQLCADGLRSGGTGIRTRHVAGDLMFELIDVGGARPAVCRANAAEQYCGGCEYQ
jgi:hypothetical protein